MTESTDIEELDEAEYDIIRAKWTLDGASTLAEAARQAAALAARLQELHDKGFLLREPVANDYAFVYHPDGRRVYED